MPTISIPEDTYKRLQRMAQPFVDTEVSVIDRLLAFYESQSGKIESNPGDARGEKIQYDVAKVPSLKHARLIRAYFGSVEIINPKWNVLVRTAHEVAFESVGNFSDLRKLSTARLFDGRKEDAGYTYIPEFGFSIQGVDANGAWNISYHLARKLELAIKAEFVWRDKAKPSLAGKTGILSWLPDTVHLRDLQATLGEWATPEDSAAYDSL